MQLVRKDPIDIYIYKRIRTHANIQLHMVRSTQGESFRLCAVVVCIFAWAPNNIELSLVVCKANVWRDVGGRSGGRKTWCTHRIQHTITRVCQNCILSEKFDLQLRACCHFSGNYLILHNDHKPKHALGGDNFQCQWMGINEFCAVCTSTLHTCANEDGSKMKRISENCCQIEFCMGFSSVDLKLFSYTFAFYTTWNPILNFNPVHVVENGLLFVSFVICWRPLRAVSFPFIA